MLEPSSVKLLGALDVLQPKDWSSCVTVDTPSTLTASRSGVEFLHGPSGAPETFVVMATASPGGGLGCPLDLCSLLLGRGVRAAPRLPGRTGRGRAGGSRYPAAPGGASLQYVPERGLHVASHCVLLT